MENYGKYVIKDENTLGFIFTGSNQMQILHGSILRGATLTWKDGFIILLPSDKIRPATKKDFEDYRLRLPPDFVEATSIEIKELDTNRTIQIFPK